MGSWFSSEPEVQAKEAITQTGNAAVQFNWAIFSTGISSLASFQVGDTYASDRFTEL